MRYAFTLSCNLCCIGFLHVSAEQLSAASQWTGTGGTPALAVNDAVRQIGERFSGLWNYPVARVYLTTQSQMIRSRQKNHFKGKELDRFYQGTELKNGIYYARFHFDDDFLREVQARERNLDKSKVEINWERISYRKEKK